MPEKKTEKEVVGIVEREICCCCHFFRWNRHREKWECRRHAPRWNTVVGNWREDTLWPEVTSDLWCGEWKKALGWIYA